MQTTAPQTSFEHRVVRQAPLASSVPHAAHPERWLHPLLLIVLSAIGAFIPAFVFAALIGSR